MKKLFSEHNLHTLFNAGVFIKALDSIGEITLGVLFYVLSPQTIYSIVNTIFGGELTEQPRDPIWNFIFHGWNGTALGAQHLWAFLFLGHGLIKIFLVIGLYKDKLWVYPTAATAFSLFAIYQMYQILYFHSLFILILTIFDILFISLIIHEYRYQKRLAGSK